MDGSDVDPRRVVVELVPVVQPAPHPGTLHGGPVVLPSSEMGGRHPAVAALLGNGTQM